MSLFLLKEKRHTLKFLASKVVFYEFLNTLNVFLSDGCYDCSCADFSGWLSRVDHEGYCFVCWIRHNYYSSDFEEIKHEPDKLIRLEVEFFADVNLCYEYDKTSVFWKKDFEYKWKLSSGETGKILLRYSDYFL